MFQCWKPKNEIIGLYITGWVGVSENVANIMLSIATCQLRKTGGMVALPHEAWVQMCMNYKLQGLPAIP